MRLTIIYYERIGAHDFEERNSPARVSVVLREIITRPWNATRRELAYDNKAIRSR